MLSLRRIAVALAGLTLVGARPAPPTPARPGAPSLVVLIVVDQMRADYISRFEGQFTGGLARLDAQGSVFLRGRQDHAITETAPGHSTILSGRVPAHTGITTNARGVPDSSTQLLDASGVGASPHRFRGTTLYDWMLAADSGSRVLSVSRKDRGAILPVGRARGQVYWFADGRFTTSSYYRDTLPRWVRRFDAQPYLRRLAGSRWTLLLPDSAYREPDSVSFENEGHDVAFPHRLPASTDRLADAIIDYPVMDSLTLAFAWAGMKALQLGQGTSTDLLSVSLSTTDAVGHAFGVDSREIHDQVLRVDRWLGRFLDSLATVVPPDRMILVLTADHGATPMPERTRDSSRSGGRLWLGGLATRLDSTLGRRYRTDFRFAFGSGLLSADTAALAARGISVDSLADALAREVRGRRGIAEVFTPASLAAAPDTAWNAWLWRRLLPPGSGWLLAVSPAPGYVWGAGDPIGEHGTTNLSDLTVPIIFLGPGIPARHWDRPVSTTDIAPTLARLIGVAPTEPLDGHPIQQITSAVSRQ